MLEFLGWFLLLPVNPLLAWVVLIPLVFWALKEIVDSFKPVPVKVKK